MPLGFSNYKSASSNDEHRQEENHTENVHETAHSTADGEGNTSDVEEYTFPFKALGSALHNEIQDSLEQSVLTMNEQQNQVTARLQPESTNDYNSNAISVHIDYGEGFKAVGYIAREVTGLLNALLSDNKIISVDIKHIRFRTTFQNIGFYITVLITKRGPWDENIVRKSKSVNELFNKISIC